MDVNIFSFRGGFDGLRATIPHDVLLRGLKYFSQKSAGHARISLNFFAMVGMIDRGFELGFIHYPAGQTRPFIRKKKSFFSLFFGANFTISFLGNIRSQPIISFLASFQDHHQKKKKDFF